MPCFHPIDAFQPRQGGRISFQEPNRGRKAKGFADFFESGHKEIKISCGQCIGCRIAKQNAWALRAMCESQLHQQNWFVTLTYDDANVPVHGALVYRHVQLFNMRLRKKGLKYRFFIAGEYGDTFGRCHWHALMFGLNLSDLEVVRTVGNGQPIYRSPMLQNAWGKGFVHIGSVTLQSARYVASYTLKKVTGEAAAEHYTRVDDVTGELIELPPEMCRMSRRPAIAKEWLDKYWPEVVTHGAIIKDGRPNPIPRYFQKRFDKMFEDDAKGRLILATLEDRRNESAESRAADMTRERLAVREQCVLARVRFRSDRFGV